MSNIKKNFNEFINEEVEANDYGRDKLRSVTVKYSDGTEISTSMAKGLTDEEIHDYFKPGKKFNIGLGPLDNVQSVVDVTINDVQGDKNEENILDEVSSVWDNGGESLDRYTIVLSDGEALGMSDNPTSPVGFSQYLGKVEVGEHLGKEISVNDLPSNVKKHLEDRLSE